jgi:hypothetical protein
MLKQQIMLLAVVFMLIIIHNLTLKVKCTFDKKKEAELFQVSLFLFHNIMQSERQ